MTTIGVQSGIFYLLSYSCPKNTGAGGVYQQCITTTTSSNAIREDNSIGLSFRPLCTSLFIMPTTVHSDSIVRL
jgi:hypothetical protein